MNGPLCQWRGVRNSGIRGEIFLLFEILKTQTSIQPLQYWGSPTAWVKIISARSWAVSEQVIERVRMKSQQWQLLSSFHGRFPLTTGSRIPGPQS